MKTWFLSSITQLTWNKLIRVEPSLIKCTRSTHSEWWCELYPRVKSFYLMRVSELFCNRVSIDGWANALNQVTMRDDSFSTQLDKQVIVSRFGGLWPNINRAEELCGWCWSCSRRLKKQAASEARFPVHLLQTICVCHLYLLRARKQVVEHLNRFVVRGAIGIING